MRQRITFAVIALVATVAVVAIVGYEYVPQAISQEQGEQVPLPRDKWPEPPATKTADELREIEKSLPEPQITRIPMIGPETRGKVFEGYVSAGDIKLPDDFEAGGHMISAMCNAGEGCVRTPALIVKHVETGAQGLIDDNGFLHVDDEERKHDFLRITLKKKGEDRFDPVVPIEDAPSKTEGK